MVRSFRCMIPDACREALGSASFRSAYRRYFRRDRRIGSNGLFACFACASGMPNRRFDLPPLDRLEAFEAAARNLSFTRAAAELSLTQSAVSRAIASLEERLGFPLFERRHRALLADRARPGAVRGDHRAARGPRRDPGKAAHAPVGTHRHRHHHPVVRFALAGAAPGWLHARASRSRHPHRREQRDRGAGAFGDRRRDPLCTAELAPGGSKLFGEDVVPVCSPALAGDPARPLARPEDLRNHVLLAPCRDPDLAMAGLDPVAGGGGRPRPATGGSAALQPLRPAHPGRAQGPGRGAGSHAAAARTGPLGRAGRAVQAFDRLTALLLRAALASHARQRRCGRIRALAAHRGGVCQRCTEAQRESRAVRARTAESQSPGAHREGAKRRKPA